MWSGPARCQGGRPLALRRREWAMGRKVLVGFLLLGALIVFALGTFYVKNWQFLLGRGYVLKARFSHAGTLATGDVVRLSGVIVGTVRSLNVDTKVQTSMPVSATLWLRHGIVVRADDEAVIRLSSLFGGDYVDITRGNPNAPPLKDGETIRKTKVAPSITEVVESAGTALNSVNSAFADIRKVTDQISQGKGALGMLVNNKNFADKVNKIADDATSTMDNLKAVTGRLNNGQGLLGKLITDNKLAAEFQSIADNATSLTGNIKDISANLKAGKGTIGKLLTDETLYTDAKSVLNTIRNGNGLIPRLLKDKTLSDNAAQTIANLSDVTGKISKGQGTLGKLLTSNETYDKLNASLDNLKTFTSDLANGKGTIGKLVTSDKVYTQITQILSDVQGLLETYREQSPVISFAGAVFGAF
jgi:phospholipid/cholesterol/gamma-HCH transport system substrate-binding protein